MNIAVYSLEDGKIKRRISCLPSMVLGMCLPLEDFFLNCPDTSTHIINNEPVTVPPSLEENKVAKIAEINQARDKMELTGFDYLGKRFDSDVNAMRRISIAVQAAQSYPDFIVEWTCQDNSTITLNAEQIIAMPLTMAVYGNELHQKARTLKAQIEAATTIDEVNLIDW